MFSGPFRSIAKSFQAALAIFVQIDPTNLSHAAKRSSLRQASQ